MAEWRLTQHRGHVPVEIPLGFWHCFGHRIEVVDLRMVRKMLDASRTELLPINTHGRKLRIGHGDVMWEDFREEAEERGLTPCLNINLQTSTWEATQQARWAIDETGIGLLKFEVLTYDYRDSNDSQCLLGCYFFMERGYQVMPLLKKGKSAISAAECGFPVIRMMGSPIGSGLGILNPSEVATAVDTGVPVILDGGIASVEHARQALELGCAGFLVNSCLFKADTERSWAEPKPEPWEKLAEFHEAFVEMPSAA